MSDDDRTEAIGPGSDPDGGRRLGDFQLLDKIGQGGMGEVYKARQISLDRIVALKLLPQSVATKPQFLERFKREARAAANLFHPNVLQVYAYGVDEGKAYIAMEFVEGEDLSDRLRRERIPLDEGVRIIKEAALALAAAGDRGVVHRDIKPANIMLNAEGQVKVMDFGLAKASDGAESGLTEQGLVVGTPKYISPEQGKGEKLDTRSDIYSLGVTFYELLTGSVPFSADSSTSLIYKHVFEAPASPRSINPDVPPFLDDVVLRMLAKKPDQRYPNGNELARDLEEFERHKDDYIATGRRRVAPTEPVEEAAPVVVAPGRASPLSLAVASVALVTALISLGVASRAPQGPRVVVTEDLGEVVMVPFTFALDVAPGTRVSWNAFEETTELEPGKEYSIREGSVTIVIHRPGYELKFVDVTVSGSQATLPDGSPLGSVDLRLQPTEELVRAYAEGRDLLEAKEYDAAVLRLEAAAGRDPDYRLAPEDPSAQELLERAQKLQGEEISQLRERARRLGNARQLHAAHRHRGAVAALATLPASYRRAEVRELTDSCRRAIAAASDSLRRARGLLLEGAIDEARDCVDAVRREDPEHEALAATTTRIEEVALARERALAASDAVAALPMVVDFVERFGSRDRELLERLERLRQEVRAADERKRALRIAETQLRLGAEREAWEDVSATASRVLRELDPDNADARELGTRADQALRLRTVRGAIDRLDRACEQLDSVGGELVGADAILALVAPQEAKALLSRLEAFLRIGRILASERRNLEVEFLPDGTAALRFDWRVELRLRNVDRVVQLTVPSTAIAEVHEGEWALAGFRSAE